jgi:hypothetical protein
MVLGRGRRIRVRLKLLVAASVVASSLARAAPVIVPRQPREEDETEETSTQPVEGAALVRQVPDLVQRPWPPRPRFRGGFVARTPLIDAGLGVGFTGFPTDWLRLGVDYAIGGSLNGTKGWVISNYAEGIVSFKILGVRSSTIKDVFKVDRYGSKEPRLVLRAALPSYHALLFEGGALTATMPMQRCVADCELAIGQRALEQRTRQLVYAFGGLRYLYNTNSSSNKWPLIDHAREVHAFAHLIARPLNDWEEARYYKSSYRLRRLPLGFRAGVVFPVCGRSICLEYGVTFGLVPVPRALLFEFSFGY